MVTRYFASFLLIIVNSLSLIRSSIIPPPPPFNLSHFIYPRVTALTESDITPQPPQFLQGVLDVIANREKWTVEYIRVSELDVKKAKFRSVQRYEFRVRAGKAEIVLKMSEEGSEWKKLLEVRTNETSDFESVARKIGSKAVIDSFKIEGPFELRVARDVDQLSLMLPLNTSHSGLHRISVSEGITVEVKGAEEITIYHPSDNHLPRDFFTYGKWPAFCTALLPIHIVGSASVVAYKSRRPDSLIQTALTSEDAIKLLPDKCHIQPNYKKPRHLLSSLRIRITLLEELLRSFLSDRGGNANVALGSLKTRIRAVNVFRFHLGLERDIRANDTSWTTLAEWRTKPTIERVWFEVVARIEGEVLKPITVKKVGPLIDTDSFSWNSILSNLSFTKLPSVLVPPEALTLDVKW
ncbi:hypothetical protein MIMGU_mgv1a007411mg [Erythranthe guttata]|nr:hypothetical protein MIMGU_mgv1a007411mg [Erythranthe guttata]